jgi:hypothetical protein
MLGAEDMAEEVLEAVREALERARRGPGAEAEAEATH